MFHSLRFRLPALFLAGIALTGVVSTLIAFGLFRNYTQNQAKKELRREAAGLTALYAQQAVRSQEKGTQPPFFAASRLERASGNKLFYVGDAVLLRPGLGAAPAPAVGAGLQRDPAGQDDRVRVHSARREPDVPGGRPSAPSRQERRPVRGPGRRHAAGPAQQPGDAARAQARARPSRRAARDRGARLVPVGTHHETRSAPRSGGRRGRGGTLRDAVARGRGPRRDRRPDGIVHADDRAAGRVGGARAELPDDGLARAANASDRDPRSRRGAPRRAHRGSGSPKPARWT